jgi:hypothetical protein
MGLYDNLLRAVDDIIKHYKSSVSDGSLTFAEVGSLAFNAASSFVNLVESMSRGDGDDKKAFVLAAISKFYDIVIAPIDIKMIPDPLEFMADQAIKGTLLAMTNASIDAIVNVFNKMGWSTPQAVEGATGEPEKLKFPVIF